MHVGMGTASSLRIAAIAIVALASALPIAGCVETPIPHTEDSTRLLRVTTTTSLISSIVEAIGDNTVAVTSIIPPSQCPGHFDIGPDAIKMLADGDIFFMHGWQGEKFTTRLIKSAGNRELMVIVLKTTGNWMVPAVQTKAVEEITSGMIEADPANRSSYENRAAELKSRIDTLEHGLKSLLKGEDLADTQVICAEKLAGFVEWAGLDIVACFSPSDDLSPQELQEVIVKGKEARVKLVISNLQSEAGAGTIIAKELGGTTQQVTLSNFPRGFEDTETWAKAIEKNIDLLIEAYAATQYQAHDKSGTKK